ncbi:anti-sigma-D factor RsdA [Actinokineospora diospyrosa]|uniref:Anti-sigma-D factor RsdA to sigma factor binding region n=1 Tax=Actinokineospora diospyrosa TaxID=103728 RepID=A0ABT1IIL9_9PSEU|nr:anti-sigma-D factor RsdA [Actinokineospora diospyrosa]MCP2272483.1 Anti-sigma-D factor RsdA to sigma factor binding region [Actinokineospora diospyrosa]
MPDQSDRDERGADDAASARPEQLNVTPVPFGAGLRLDDEYADLAESDDAVDISRVHADDAFLDALGAAVRGERVVDDPLAGSGYDTAYDSDLPPDFRDDELAALLSSWRDEVDSAPIGELVDAKLAVATVVAAKARGRRRPRLLVPFAAAAAVLAIAFTGAGLAARDAQPGDTLWSLTKVLYADHARSVEAAASVREDLDIAQTALADGKLAEAKSKLEDAKKGLPAVASEDGAAELAATHADLLSQLPGSPANGAQPPPLPTPTTIPPATTTSPSTTTSLNPPPVTTSQSSPPVPTSEPSTPPSTTTTPSETTTPQSEVPRLIDPEPGAPLSGPASGDTTT